MQRQPEMIGQRISLLKIDPPSLIIIPPDPQTSDAGDKPARTVLTLSNVDASGRNVAFKIRIKLTTNGWTYLVRPSTGVVRGDASATMGGIEKVEITVQPNGPVDQLPTADQFLIQAVPLGADRGTRVLTRDEWHTLSSRSAVQEDILRVWWPSVGSDHLQLFEYMNDLSKKNSRFRGGNKQISYTSTTSSHSAGRNPAVLPNKMASLANNYHICLVLHYSITNFFLELTRHHCVFWPVALIRLENYAFVIVGPFN